MGIMQHNTSDLDLIESLLKATTLSTSFDDFCRRAVHQTLRPLAVSGLYLATAEVDGSMQIRGQYGLRVSNNEQDRFTHWSDTGLAQALRDGLPVHFSEQATLRQLFGPDATCELEGTNAGAIFVPFARYELVIGGLCAVLKEPLRAEPESWLELETITWAAELLLSRGLRDFQVGNPIESRRSEIGSITAREARVLQLAREGLTNGQIAKQLHLSESAIKQELSRTYRKLRASGRSEAISKFEQLPAPELADVG